MFTHALFFVLQAVINLVDASYLHRSNPRARGESEREREHGTLPYFNPPHSLPKTRLLLYAHTCLFVVLQEETGCVEFLAGLAFGELQTGLQLLQTGLQLLQTGLQLLQTGLQVVGKSCKPVCKSMPSL